MEITIIGTESLGVRGLCCSVKTKTRDFLIDPGVALGYLRHGHLPHPCQVAVGDAVRKNIISAFSEATDIIISHYHGDHIPLLDANPYQISLKAVTPANNTKFWCKGTTGISSLSVQRRDNLIKQIEGNFTNADGISSHNLSFSEPVPHGTSKSHLGSVMMSCIREEDTKFVHASDIQMLNSEAVGIIMEWEPDVVIASGPPLYLNKISEKAERKSAENVIAVAGSAGTLILDHHLLRSHSGCSWLKEISKEAGGNVVSAADFMQKKPLLLEACRDELYEMVPVPAGWHEAYKKGKANLNDFRIELSDLEKICES